MKLKTGTEVHGFAIETREDLPEIEGEAFVGRHVKSGARLLYLKNDDNDKSFAIGFRTPPNDDTGVFHILEHSVLCGSRKFPVKEPFVDLLKGSMQTFLNAMTFDDKTLYPVASTNEQDLYNLMDVYLDAVFHPRIFEKRAIFEQEGWHYELKAAGGSGADAAELGADESVLVHNGVVFNEMKGALSDSNSVFYDELQKALFPDTCYAFESGGTPAGIPTLTYEGFLDEHRRHYRTDNSYIVLYGNLDIDRALAFLDERYLTPVAEEQRAEQDRRAQAGLEPLEPREIAAQAPRKAGYVRTTMDTSAEHAVAGSAYVIGNASQRVRVMAADILTDALFGSNEAPLKRALLDEGIAHEVTAFVADAMLQPFVIVQLNMPRDGAAETFQDTLAAHVRELLERGLDKKLVEAALSHAEFVMREHDMSISDGVIYAMTSLAGWLYDEDAAVDYLRYEQDFAQLREALEGDYFERLCAELFLENPHTATVEIVPTPGVSDDDSRERLAEMNRALTPAERRGIVDAEAALRELQEAPDTPEAQATLPRLGISDIGEAPDEPAYAFDEQAPIRCIRHEVPTRGIAYAYRYFDASCIPFEDVPYISILSMVLGKLDTAQHSAADIDTITHSKLGNLTFYVNVYEDFDDIAAIKPRFAVSSSALASNVEWLATLPREIMCETDFSDTGKILDILKQRKIGLEHAFSSAGHSSALSRCKSYYSHAAVYQEQLLNVGFYRFLCELIDDFDNRAGDLAQRLQDISTRLFNDESCLISFAGTDGDYERFWDAGPACGRREPFVGELEVPAPTVRNEAFIVPSDVCFAAYGWDRRLTGDDFDGSWTVAAQAASLDYLWNEVRVKGGAYGVGFKANSSGNLRFYSYRDPHLDETIERFAQAAAWLADFDPSDEELQGFVVATVAKIDQPVKPRELIRRQMGEHFSNRTRENRLENRRRALATDRDAIRSFGKIVAKIIDANATCVFGSREIIESSKRDWDVITLVG